MATEPARTSRAGAALLVGLAATAIVVACQWARLDGRAELMALDWRFRNLSTVRPDPQVLIVQIDDASLKKVGRWPWPREALAGVVGTLQECGARAVALDIILPEPQETRYEAPGTDVYDPDMAPVIGSAGPRAVFDDSLLEDALRKARVFLPMHVDFSPSRLPDPNELRVAGMVDEDPQADFAAILRKALPGIRPGERTRGLEEAAAAYVRQRALRSLRRFAIPPDRIGDHPAKPGVVIPPLVRFADPASGTGFVTFQPDEDGVMRRIPLLARAGDDVYGQFAFRLAAELVVGGRGVDIAADRAGVRFSATTGPPASQAATRPATQPAPVQRAVPVDAAGRLLINWCPRAGQFQTMPASAAVFIWQLRGDVDRNRRYGRLIGLELAQQLKQDDLLKLYAQADLLYRQRLGYEVARQRARLYEPRHVPAPPTGLHVQEQQVERRIDELTRELLDNLDFLIGSVPKDDPHRRVVEALAARHEELRAQSADRQNEIVRERGDLRPRVEGRICLVGSTATGAADFVPTPTHPRMPGVEVHANILNTIASDAYVREAPLWLNLLIAAAAGILVSFLAARLTVLHAGPLTAVLATALVAGNFWIIFALLHWWLAVVAPVAATVAALLAVTAYRQSTEERAKRHLRRLFAHTLSPVLVDQLLADPSQLDPRRRALSCFFSDLQSFTPMAERIGERDTVDVLKRYFDRMTDIIQQRHGGYLNKFLGDGILGFFGAPVELPDHARRALAAAADCVREIDLLNAELSGRFGGTVRLRCRVGISSGTAMFGNCGSTDRSDYTAIGNLVNLASRLESANKQFGTSILVDERAWTQGRDGAGGAGRGADSVAARPFGKIIVVGMAEPVAVWNLLGPSESVSPELRQAAAEFAGGVDLFARRRFEQAAEAFQSLLARWPADRACELFLSLCRQYLTSPPPEDWDGAIRLTEK